jgi:hypothetical protein
MDTARKSRAIGRAARPTANVASTALEKKKGDIPLGCSGRKTEGGSNGTCGLKAGGAQSVKHNRDVWSETTAR